MAEITYSCYENEKKIAHVKPKTLEDLDEHIQAIITKMGADGLKKLGYRAF
jgi:hypothetical protein